MGYWLAGVSHGAIGRARGEAGHSRRESRRSLSKRVSTVALLIAALSVAGCGAGNGTTAAGQSPAKFVASADAICTRLNSEIAEEAPNNAGMTEVAHVASRHALTEQAILSELGKLVPPVSLAHGWKQLVAYRQQRVENLKSLAKYAASNDVRGVSSVAKTGEGLLARLRAAANGVGSRACAEA